jgi:uncharacterized membrane protein
LTDHSSQITTVIKRNVQQLKLRANKEIVNRIYLPQKFNSRLYFHLARLDSCDFLEDNRWGTLIYTLYRQLIPFCLLHKTRSPNPQNVSSLNLIPVIRLYPITRSLFRQIHSNLFVFEFRPNVNNAGDF